jgi:hypothetical protein
VETRRLAAQQRLTTRETQLRQLRELRAEVQRLDVRLSEGFRKVYTDPALARSAYDQVARVDGAQAVRQLRESPEVYGELRGRALLGRPTAERSEAVRAAEPTAAIAGEHVRADGLARAAERTRPELEKGAQEAQAEIRSADEQLRQMESRGDLVVRAGQAIEQLGPAERAALQMSDVGAQVEEVVTQMQTAVAAADRAASTARSLLEGREQGGRGRGGHSL